MTLQLNSVFISLGSTPRSTTASHMVTFCLAFWGTYRLFSKTAVPFHIPFSKVWGFREISYFPVRSSSLISLSPLLGFSILSPSCPVFPWRELQWSKFWLLSVSRAHCFLLNALLFIFLVRGNLTSFCAHSQQRKVDLSAAFKVFLSNSVPGKLCES